MASPADDATRPIATAASRGFAARVRRRHRPRRDVRSRRDIVRRRRTRLVGRLRTMLVGGIGIGYLPVRLFGPRRARSGDRLRPAARTGTPGPGQHTAYRLTDVASGPSDRRRDAAAGGVRGRRTPRLPAWTDPPSTWPVQVPDRPTGGPAPARRTTGDRATGDRAVAGRSNGDGPNGQPVTPYVPAVDVPRAHPRPMPGSEVRRPPVRRLPVTVATGAVVAGSARSRSARSRPAAQRRPRAVPATPEQRFTARLAAGPRAASQPLPSRFTALARVIAGRVPRYRTGEAVRAALDAAGAHAATVDGMLHLPAPPDTSPHTLGVVAHELSHVAEGGHHAHDPRRRVDLARPRFLLDRLSGVADAGERQARRMGDMVRAGATRPLPAASGLPVGPPAGLPAISGLPGVRDVTPPDIASLPVGGPGAALSAARQAIGDVEAATSGLGERAMAEAGGMLGARPGVPALPDTAGSAVDALAGAVGDPGALLRPALAAGGPAVAGVRGATDTVTSGVQAAVGEAAGVLGDADSRIGALMEALEERLLTELERRGGRYAGVF